MLRHQIYQRIVDQFGTGLGIAEWDGAIYESYTNTKAIPDEMKVIILTNWIISKGIYQQVIRDVIRLEGQYKRKRINPSTIYEKAINNIMGSDSPPG